MAAFMPPAVLRQIGRLYQSRGGMQTRAEIAFQTRPARWALERLDSSHWNKLSGIAWFGGRRRDDKIVARSVTEFP